jgi:hypothetical protein
MTHHDDHPLDARLRDVPVPAGIANHMVTAALFDDAALDKLLVRVDMPAGIEDRVRCVRAATPRGGAVPLEAGLQGARQAASSAGRGGRAVWSAGRMLSWLASGDLLADGAAVAAALSIVAAMFFAGTELSRRLATPVDVRNRVAVRAAPSADSSSAVAPASLATAADTPSGNRLARPTGQADASAVGGDRGLPTPGRSQPGPDPEAAAGASRLAIHAAAVPPSAEAVEAGVEVRAAPVFAPAIDAGRSGAGGIRTVRLPTAGRRVPRVPGFDIAFEMAHGESPFVDPAASSTLATDHPPLSLRTDSFDMLCDAARRDGGRTTGRRTSRATLSGVRGEDILAALPAGTAADAWEGPGIGLSIHAVRSLRAAPGSLLVEVCATAPPLAGLAGESVAEKPLDAMLLLDQSAGPFAALSWQWLCRGLGRVISQMRPADRLSLIVCGERPRLVALRADAVQLAGLLPELLRESEAKAADFDAALRLAAAVGRREGRPDRVVAVAHAGSLEQCREEGRAALSAWLADRNSNPLPQEAHPVAFVLVDPQEPLHAAGGDREANEMGMGRTAADAIAIGRAMVMRTFGRPTLVATGCRLEVAFDPARVGAYRIVGHRQTVADALATDSPRPIDLHAGESVRVVYEVVRRRDGATAASTRSSASTSTGAGASTGLVAATVAWTPAFDRSGVAGRNGTGGQDRAQDLEQRARAVWADGNAAVPGAGGSATADLGPGLPSPHGCELLLAVALGELAAASVHAEPWRQPTAGIATLAARWQARGDVTPEGRLLIDCLEYRGVFFDRTR